MEFSAPRSTWADQRIRNLIAGTIIVGESDEFVVFPIFFSLMFSGFFAIFAAFIGMIVLTADSPPQAKFGYVFGYLVVFGGLFYLIFSDYQRKKRKILIKNEEDYALSLKVKDAAEAFGATPPDLVNVPYQGVETYSGFVPVRIQNVSESTLDGELCGSLRGTWGLFTLSGYLSGNVKGDVIPDINNQNVIITAVDHSGKAIRFICPSILVAKRNFKTYFKKASREYGKESHTCVALREFEDKVIEPLLDKPNPQAIYSQVEAMLDEPREKRTALEVRGIETKDGTVLVSAIGCEGRAMEAVAPVALLGDAREALDTVLPKALPEPKGD